MYTSGSTGTPKGVMVEHRQVLAFLHGFEQVAPGGEGCIGAAVCPFGFDVSVWECFSMLCFGGTLHIILAEVLTAPRQFVHYLVDHRITSAYIPPTLLSDVASHLEQRDQIVLKRLLVGVEPLQQGTLQRFRNLSEQMHIVNGYGPTETTVCATLFSFRTATEPDHRTPIGTGIYGYEVYLVDANMQPVTMGIPGELLIGGAGLARGYINRPELTAERFIPHPFSTVPGACLYKTGDLARCLPDGNLEFLGRIDHQVKIRGFRIELGEIEVVLDQHPAVRQAVVLAREDFPGDKRLVAYVVLNQEQAPMSSELRSFLRKQLPDYMVPSAFVLLDTLPLTRNGKVDRRALPTPDAVKSEFVEAFVTPRGPVEEVLAGIWAEVLGLERVSVHDSFFDLGGHSLKASQIIYRVRDALHIELPLRSIFETPSVAELATIIEKDDRGDPSLQLSPIQSIPRDSDLPLSFSQERVWFIQQLEPTNIAYNFQVTLRLTGLLDVAALERSLSEIVRRHEIYRTTFPTIDGQPVQVIHQPQPVQLPMVELQALPEREREVEAQRLISKEIQKPFDLTQLPLIRWTLLSLSEQEHVLVHIEHHLLHDGWSFNVFLRELLELYQAFSVGAPSPLPDLAIQFVDFARWQRQWIQGQVAETHLAYWKEKLADSLPVLALPSDRPRPAVQSFQGAAAMVELPLNLCKLLRALSRQEGVTLFMTMLAAFVTLLHRYSGQHDLCVGSGIANRRGRETEGLIGMIINHVVLRTDLSGNPMVRELLDRVCEITLEASTHQDLPFEKVVDALQPKRDPSHNPLFQVSFSFHDAPMPDLELPGLTINIMPMLNNGSAKFDLNVIVIPHSEQRVGLRLGAEADGLTVGWEYNTDLFDETTITRMSGHYQTLLESIVADSTRRISDLPLFTEAERHQLLMEWNGTARDYPHDQCLHQLFEAQVERTPDTVAVVFEDEQLTYRDLNRRANQLAHHLRALGVGPEVLVGICMERSLEIIVGILGILKAGGAYVPLEPTYPKERLAFMLQDIQAPVLLAQEGLVGRLPELVAQVLCLDTAWEAITRESEQNPGGGAIADGLAYVIYTSGSTGRPKGVMNTHRGVCNRLRWMQDVHRLTATDRVLQKTPFSFDVSVWEFFWPLATGARLIVARPGGHQDPAYLVKLIAAERITTLHFVPAMLQQFLEEQGLETCHSMRRVMCSGEALSIALQQRFFSRLDAELHNLYGPTEAAIDVTYWACEREGNRQTVPIGRPIANTQIYLLDSYLQPVPIGVPGELHIGGTGLARGYLNRPELTAEQFIPHPFSDERGARLYKTGDLARYAPDGSIEFLGRLDDQLKIRGFRIEPEEIESVLYQQKGVYEAAVLAREDVSGDKRLVAYLVPDQQHAFTVRQLLRFERKGLLTGRLRYELPNGMVIFHQHKNETDFMYKEIFEEQTYWRHGITLNEGDCIFDVGANIGLFALFIDQICKNTTTYAFEPSPPIFDVLRINTALYGLNVKLFDCGLSNFTESRIFTYYPNISIISGYYADELQERELIKSFLLNQEQLGVCEPALWNNQLLDELLAERLTCKHFTCQFKTISHVMREHGVERIDLLKIDVEKSEQDVLAGIQDDDWTKIRQLVVEVHDIDSRLERITTLLKHYGYDLHVHQDVMFQDTGLYNIYAVQGAKGQAQLCETREKRASEYRSNYYSKNKFLSDVRHSLTEKLPDYMVPAAFVLLEALPLTPNGKVDRRALPALDGLRPEREAAYVAPRTEIERIITAVWQEVLRIKKVGVYDNFFDLGGHSLLLIQVYSKLQEVFNKKISVVDMFTYPSINALTKYLSQNKSEQASDRRSEDAMEKLNAGKNRLKQLSQRRQRTRENR
jgi:amino acid adenylation domain-containing protein/FkbM family methyltransferase